MSVRIPIAVITGSGSGLGRALVKRFIDGGYRVVGIDLRRGSDLEGLTELEIDITDPNELQKAFARAAEMGALEVLVNAAGVYPRSTLADATVDSYRLIFDVNVLGTVLSTQAFMAARRPEDGGSVINVASVDALKPFSKSVLYSAAKAAVVNFTEGISEELAEQNVRVHAIAPDYIATERIIELVGGMPPSAATPEQVAATCWDLTRPNSLALFTGQTIVLRKGPLD